MRFSIASFDLCHRPQHGSPHALLFSRVYSLFFFAAFTLCAVVATQAQSPGLNVPIKVNNAAVPVTIGLPLAEAANVRETTDLGVLDPNNAAVPSQMRVLSRWRGLPGDQTRPIKWVLVDFKPSVIGTYTLTRTTQTATMPSLSVIDAASKLSLSTARLGLEFSRQGTGLLTSFKLDGTEQMRAPLTVEVSVPRGGIVVKTVASNDALYLSDASLLKVGDVLRFTHTARLLWDMNAGTTQFPGDDENLPSGHRYLLDEGTAQQEEIAAIGAAGGMLTGQSPFRFKHAAGCPIRDLTAEEERATIKSVSGQLVQFTAALKQTHAFNEQVSLADASVNPVKASATIEKTSIEENNALRIVVRQDGHFTTQSADAAVRVLSEVGFTLRYYVYADQPFVRVRVRLVNQGTYGFGASRVAQPPYTQHALLRSLSALIPTVAAAVGSTSVLTATESHARVTAKQNSALLAAGGFEISVPEFAENFPKALNGNASGLRFDLLPDSGSNYIFEGARAKTTDFYLGKQTNAALALTNSLAAVHDPAYIARSGAVRPVMIERRIWSQVFPQDAEMSEAADYAERQFAVAYAVESCEGNSHQPPQSVFEYRLRGESGEHFGWQNFGDLAWGDGYSNLHYDLPFMLLREYLRTSDARAFQLGSEMARYRSDWGQYHADDYLDSQRTWNVRGYAFYEKGKHGSYREPIFTHNWVEGLWLYWALTGDEAVHEAALEASDTVTRFAFTYDSSLSWNEPRMAGWPALAMVAAWRYSGDLTYLTKARDIVYVIVQAEEDYGRKGYYIAPGSGIGNATQPFMWSGYTQFGVIEFWRETSDQRVADFIVRVADWLIGQGGQFPVLLDGKTSTDGSYHPLGTAYTWSPDKAGENPLTAQGMLSLPVLTVAARISKRADLRNAARQLFRDTAFYRDFPAGAALTATSRAPINFRSLQYGASSPKIYGQTGFSMGDYLAELNSSLTLPETATAIPAPTPVAKPKQIIGNPSFSTTSSLSCLNAMAFSGQTNLALNRPATASSVHLWPNATDVPETANDGLLNTADGRISLWHSESNRKELEWWQVEIAQAARISGVEILFRNDNDQANTRRNFEVRASNDPTFATSVLLAAQGPTPHPFRQAWQARVSEATTWRYVRIRKTAIDPDEFGQSYFNLSEVRVYAADPNADFLVAASEPISVADLRPKTVMVGQTLNFILARTDSCGQPIRHLISGLPKNATFEASSGSFTFTPSAEQADQLYQVAFRSGDITVEIVTKFDIAVIQSGAPRVTLMTPTRLVHLVVNQSSLISWATDSAAPVSKYQIKLSTDGGGTWPTIIAELPGTAHQFDWKVPASLAANRTAPIRLMVAALDANNRVGLDSTHEDLQLAAPLTVTSAASYRPGMLAAGAICAAFGGSLTRDGGGLADQLPLPDQIRHTRIEIIDSRGRQFYAPLFYTSLSQINFLLPDEAAPGDAVVTVIASTGELSESRISIGQTAPAIFTTDASGSGEAVMIATTDGVHFEAGAVRQDATRDVYVVLFGTGWHGTGIQGASGSSAPPAQAASVEINNVPVNVIFAGKQPDFAGLDQLNFTLPRDLRAGTYSLVIKVGDQVSNSTVMRVY